MNQKDAPRHRQSREIRATSAMRMALVGLLFWRAVLAGDPAQAVTTQFFTSSQATTITPTTATTETLASNGYLITYTRDNLFTGGGNLTTPIGRPVMVTWPAGVEAQAVTTGPIGSAQLTIRREDGQTFDINAFTAKLLANTAATGAAIEVMPMVGGQDGLLTPMTYDVTGYANNSFSFTPSAELAGFDTYQFSLFCDFAITSITVADASVAPPPSGGTLGLVSGWNLVSATVPVPAATFNDPGLFTSVWKWQGNTWSVALSGESPPGAYAQSKSFGQLATINPGEGFWVNSKVATSVNLTGTPEYGLLSFAPGWNLVGLKSAQAVAASDLSAGDPNILSIWKMANGVWAVYLPGETPPGAYAQSKGFVVLGTINPGEGFWVNRQ